MVYNQYIHGDPWYTASPSLLFVGRLYIILKHTILYHIYIYIYMVVSWNRGTPSHHPFVDRIFPNITPPSELGVPTFFRAGHPHVSSRFLSTSRRTLATGRLFRFAERAVDVSCGRSEVPCARMQRLGKAVASDRHGS